MNEYSAIIIFVAALFSFIGYIIGNVTGFSKGIHSATNIWENSYKIMSEAFFNTVRKKPENKGGRGE